MMACDGSAAEGRAHRRGRSEAARADLSAHLPANPDSAAFSEEAGAPGAAESLRPGSRGLLADGDHASEEGHLLHLSRLRGAGAAERSAAPPEVAKNLSR